MSEPETPKRRGNPRMVKGAPSVNPQGRGAPIAKAASNYSAGAFAPPGAPPTKPAGADAIPAPGGFLYQQERDPRLTNREKWVTFDNMTLNVAIVASAVGVWTQLGGSAKWSAEPNQRGGKDAQRGADIVTEGLLTAQTSKPWCAVVRRQLMKKFRGFAMHEGIIRRRADGMVVFGDLQHRPQWTVWRWNKPDEQSEWTDIEQLTRMGGRYTIPRERLYYSVEDTLTDSPDGIGVLRQLAESVRVLELYMQWEGIGFQTDLRGIPVLRAPLGALRDAATAAGAATEGDIRAYVLGATQFMRDFLDGHNKTPDQGFMLDSTTYRARDEAQAVSSIYQWSADIVRSATSGMPEIGTAIGRVTRDIARIMCAEWLLLGGEDSGGAYSMHEDKTAMFGLLVNSALNDVAADATRDLAARLVALNGLDPETCTPKLVPEPVATGAVESACRSLLMLSQAGLHPRDEAINVIRGRLDLPQAPDIDDTDWMLPRGAIVVPDADPTEATPDNQPAKPDSSGKKPVAATPAIGAGKPGNVNADPATHDGGATP